MSAQLKIAPYLNFDGNAEEAFTFYQSVLGGKLSEIMRFRDMPPSEPQFPPDEAERVLHVSLDIDGEFAIMGSDTSRARGPQFVAGNNFYLSLNPDSKEEAQRLFTGLSAGGKIEMPLENAFWGDYFGSFTDKYGIQWMVSCEAK